MRGALILSLALATCPALAAEPLADEILLQVVPDGFVIGHAADNGREAITELVPRGETVRDWSRMLTVQVMRGRGHVTPAQFRAAIGEAWLQACPDGRVAAMSSAAENGYPTGVWVQECPRNPATGKPEYTSFKAIQGHDSLYVLQAARRAVPTDAELAEQARWLQATWACDSRRPGQACPGVR